MPRRSSARRVRVSRTRPSRRRTRAATGTAIPGTATARWTALGDATRATSARSPAALGCGLNPAAIGAAARSGQPTGANFTLAESGTGFEAWGNGNGSADLNYGFDATGGGLYDFRMLGEFTDDWDVNEIGWYELSNPQNRHTIFGASAAVGATAQVFIPTNFGFYYLNTSGNGEIFYTQSQFNTATGPTSSSSPPSSAASTPSSASRTSSRTC